ncbi:sarcoglycan alpha [Anticarsia gemmatalis]|uniref:sarcoglycan alpha n=1 Tax=Anticarsia gemmatalis TaxID=129554 RepID=UPI003F768E7E
MYLLCLLLAVGSTVAHTHNAVETEMFAIPISPNLFNWTYQEFDQQYRFHASLIGKPELPSWLRYIYSGRHHSGFIFGTPPRGSAGETTLEVIGLNRQDYETRRVLLMLDIRPKEKMARHEVELKIDNLNVEDLLDEHKMTRLKDILRTKLWTESSQDLYATFLASAIDLGARLPLKPSDGEGLVVRLGSSVPFSTELKRLREEVRPLSRLPSCPREYKRTTVERLFRDAGLTLDWCSFELYNTVYKERSTVHLEYLTEVPNTSKTAKSFKALDTRDSWSAPDRSSLPVRSYARLLTAALLGPLTLLLLALTGLTTVVCALHATVTRSKVEMCVYGCQTEPAQVADNNSNKSAGPSPNNSLFRPYSPKSSTNIASNYNRPQPPPYMGSATNSLHNRKSVDKTPSTSGHTPEHRTHLLEESLKLLNEAKISSEFDNLPLKDPIIDINDGTEDYVPIKPDQSGYISMKPDQTAYVPIKADLDDIEVPDLAKFGIAGSI